MSSEESLRKLANDMKELAEEYCTKEPFLPRRTKMIDITDKNWSGTQIAFLKYQLGLRCEKGVEIYVDSNSEGRTTLVIIDTSG